MSVWSDPTTDKRLAARHLPNIRRGLLAPTVLHDAFTASAAFENLTAEPHCAQNLSEACRPFSHLILPCRNPIGSTTTASRRVCACIQNSWLAARPDSSRTGVTGTPAPPSPAVSMRACCQSSIATPTTLRHPPTHVPLPAHNQCELAPGVRRGDDWLTEDLSQSQPRKPKRL